MADRILLFLHDGDSAQGRTMDDSDWHNRLRHDLFMFSPRFLHSTEIILLNIVHWEETREYGQPKGQEDAGLELPHGTMGVSALTQATRQRFRLALRTLIQKRYINAFVSSLRALKGMGGKKIPLPQVWSPQNRDKLSEIAAISLTLEGFGVARELSRQHRVMQHWQVHSHAALDEVFAAWITGRKPSNQ